MKKLIGCFYILVIVFFMCCSESKDNSYYSEYYENDSLKKKCFISNNRDSTCKTYFENGKLKSEYSIIDGELEGKFYKYNIFGELVKDAIFLNGEPHGYCIFNTKNGTADQSFFYENGIPKIVTDYYYSKNPRYYKEQTSYIREKFFKKKKMTIDSAFYLGDIVYDSLGKVVEKLSNYYTIDSKNDTVKKGEVFEAIIRVYNNNREEKHFLCLGEFDDNFDPISTFDTVEIKNKVYHYTEKPKQTGINEIRGIILRKGMNEDYLYKTPVYYNYVVVDHSKSVAGHKISAENIPDPGLVYGDESCWGGWFVREPIHEHQPDYSQNFKHRKKYFAFLLPGYFIKYNFAF